MQNSSEFQYIAIDQLFESKTNPRKTFDQKKLEELAESIRSGGLIQPIVVRPKDNAFEIVAGARRFRAGQLAEQFSLPARIKELTDAQALEWQLVENSQREDVHPYEEAQGFQSLLDLPGYDVAALVEKSGKSASHIYARLSLLQLIPAVAEAFQQERITASHASVDCASAAGASGRRVRATAGARTGRTRKRTCFRPSTSARGFRPTFILNLADAPFDREDPTLNPTAGACVTCPRRSGFNTSLFADVQGDQCLDAPCFQAKVTAHIDREIAARPELVTIETAWRAPKEQRPGALQKHQYRELDIPDNPDAEPPCSHTKSALIVFGKHAGRTLTVCVDPDCPVHNPREAARVAADPPPIMAPAAAQETEEEAAQREAEHEERMAEYRAEQERKEEERKAESERQQKEYEAEQARRDKQRKARLATFDRILEQTPAVFTATQFRLFLRLVVYIDPYSFLEEVASHFAGDDENHEQTEQEIVLAALGNTADEKLTSFALRLALTDHLGLPRDTDPDLLSEAEALFAPPQAKPKKASKPKAAPTLVKPAEKKTRAKKQKAA